VQRRKEKGVRGKCCDPGTHHELGLVPGVDQGGLGELGELLHGLFKGVLVALHDLRGVHANAEEALCLGQELPRHGDDKVGAIPHLLHLHLGSPGEHLGGGVHNLQLLHDRGGVTGHKQLLQVVHHQLVHAIGAQGRPGDGSQTLARLNVLQNGLLQPTKVLVALLEQGGKPTSVPVLSEVW